jgi:predicted nicotinamide N-methyase
MSVFLVEETWTKKLQGVLVKQLGIVLVSCQGTDHQNVKTSLEAIPTNFSHREIFFLSIKRTLYQIYNQNNPQFPHTMAVPRPSKYIVPTSQKDNVSLVISEASCEAEGLHLVTWSSAFLLSKELHRLQIDRAQLRDPVTGYSILELGAGTGLTGIAAAAVWGGSALLTDLPTIIPGIQVNADLNREAIAAYGGRVACGTLDWNSPDRIYVHATSGETGQTKMEVNNESAFPVIVTADTMYTEDHPRLVSQTILKCLRKTEDARAVVMYAMRIAYIDHIREFWELMEAGGLVAVQEGRAEIDLKDWDDEKLHEWCVWKWKDL